MIRQPRSYTKTQFVNISLGALLGVVFVFPFNEVRALQFVAVVGAPLIGFLILVHWSRHATRKVDGSLVHLFVLPVLWYIVAASLYTMAYRASLGLGSQILLYGKTPVTNPAKLLYFSVITASTLGYGDCCPKGFVVCFLSCAQVIQFWLYLAIAVYVVNRTLKEIAEKRQRAVGLLKQSQNDA